MKYDIQYFIDKFEAIPADKWTKGIVYDFTNDRCCALGHCGVREVKDGEKGSVWTKTEEANALETIFRNKERYTKNIHDIYEIYYFWRVNDRVDGDNLDGKKIKEHVINWLKKEKERLDASNQT